MATIQEKVNNLIEMRNKINSIKEQLIPIKAEKEALQADIIKHMTRQGFDSVKTKSVTVSKSVRKTLDIVDEDELISHLKEKKLNDLFKVQLVKPLFNGYATQAIKEEINIPGTVVGITEYISVRNTGKGKKDDKR